VDRVWLYAPGIDKVPWTVGEDWNCTGMGLGLWGILGIVLGLAFG
jgi:hypothetical protein